MKFLVRCDSSIKIGTGHVVRCLHLAEMILKKQHEVFFVCKELTGNIISLIEEKQIKVIRLPGDLLPENEPKHIGNILNEENPDFIILDHYYLPLSWELVINSRSIPLMIIDDSFSRQHTCDFFLNQNYVNEYKHIGKQKNFIGPEYAVLSSDFLNSPIPERSFNEVKKILVFFGGTDPRGDTYRYLKTIKKQKYNLEINVVLGKTNLDIPKIQTLVEDWSNVKLHIQTKDMSSLMRDSDLYIGAGGTVTWERAYMGLPALCIAVADNQIEIAQAMAQNGIHMFLGSSDEIKEDDFIQSLESILNNHKARKILSEKSLKLKVSSKLHEMINIITN